MMLNDRLDQELRRLFAVTGSAPDPAGDPAGPMPCGGRLLVLRLQRSADWEALSGLLAGLVDDLQLPRPALTVEAAGGYRVWFSLAEPQSAVPASQLLAALCRRYLAGLPDGRLASESPAQLPEMPALDPESGRWSAFIDPGLGAMFCDEPGLDFPPVRDRQADLLVGLRSWRAADVERALRELAGASPAPAAVEAQVPAQLSGAGAIWQQVGTAYRDPRDFLMAVMNDPGAAPEHRLRAAEALLRHGPG